MSRTNGVDLGSPPIGRTRIWVARISWLWKAILLVFAITAAGWGAAKWESAAVKAAHDSIQKMNDRLIRVEQQQNDMHGDLKLIKRRLLGVD